MQRMRGAAPDGGHQRARAVTHDRLRSDRRGERLVDRRRALEGYGHDDDGRGGGCRRVLRAVDLDIRPQGLDRLARFRRGATRVARPDRHVVAGPREAQGEAEPLGAGPADDRDVHPDEPSR